ncbi:MAG: antitoxin [Gammaproteobacteria bacterium RIFCSPLOWO2_02_FULL_56_15]|nr:MAG: antitoxin [Gammaproteobacteria bacterium RIFCSPLOWO2_02_FULL_56_15]
MNWKDRIEVNPAVLVGKPIIMGTRISVELILDRLADGWTMEDVLASYPHVGREDVLAALSFASELFKEETFVAVGKVNT